MLNLHTAYYNESGDLIGVKTSGRDAGKADLKRMYWNYATGWMAIDVLSVLPVELIIRLYTGGQAQTGSELKALKTLRLIRLLKLFRLLRGLHMFKKHEDQLGPAVPGILTIGIYSV